MKKVEIFRYGLTRLDGVKLTPLYSPNSKLKAVPKHGMACNRRRRRVITGEEQEQEQEQEEACATTPPPPPLQNHAKCAA